MDRPWNGGRRMHGSLPPNGLNDGIAGSRCFKRTGVPKNPRLDRSTSTSPTCLFRTNMFPLNKCSLCSSLCGTKFFSTPRMDNLHLSSGGIPVRGRGPWVGHGVPIRGRTCRVSLPLETLHGGFLRGNTPAWQRAHIGSKRTQESVSPQTFHPCTEIAHSC